MNVGNILTVFMAAHARSAAGMGHRGGADPSPRSSHLQGAGRNPITCSADSMQILLHSAWPWLRNRRNLCGLFAAPRTSHPQRELFERRLPAYTIVQVRVAKSHGTRRTTHHTHEEVAEAVIEPLDVSEHAHAHMVRSHRARVCSVRDNVLNCTTSGRNQFKWLGR